MLSGAGIAVERADGVLEGLLHGHDAIEAGGVQQADQSGAVAVHHDPALVLPDAADPADQRAEAGGVDEGHAAEVHNQATRGGVLGQSLAELGDSVGIELAGGAEPVVRLCVAVRIAAERLDVEHGPRIPGQERPHSPAPAGRYHLGVPDVLLVTDADWVAEQCGAALDGDCGLHRVRRGADALEAIGAVEPHLVLLDMQVGNMGGMAACLAIRQEEDMGRLDRRPVIMLLDREADEFLARRSTADAWLVKPIDPLRLSRLVASTLAGAADPS